MKGKHCKIVINEPGNKKANVMYGTLKDIDHEKGFIILETESGLGMINKKTIVAIKPNKKQ